MNDQTYQALRDAHSAEGAIAVFDELVNRLRQEGKYHELFDALLMQSRYKLGLPLQHAPALDDLPEPVRTKTEEAYMAACREVGQLLLERGELAEAWTYLRPLGEKPSVANAIARTEVTDDNVEELVQLALHEGIAPELGFELVLEHYGTCNAITLFEGVVASQAIEHQRAAAERLVRHLHAELLENVRAHIATRDQVEPTEDSLTKLIAEHTWIFEAENYHIDVSHLASVVRFSRLLEDRQPVRLARDLAHYGRHLAPALQLAGEEPFVDLYPSHELFLAATLGERTAEAVAFFGDEARGSDPRREGTAAIETYLILLVRLGRHDEALEASVELAPQGVELSPYAPSRLWLALQSGKIDRYLELCRQQGNLVGYAAGLVEGTT